MTSRALAVTDDGRQETWTDAELKALRTAGFNAPKRYLDLLYHVARTSGLDPLRKHLYMVQDRDGWAVRTTIAGLLTAARRATNATGGTLAITAPSWGDRDGQWHDLWGPGDPPVAARVTVVRDGHTFEAVALFAEYAVFTEAGLNETWSKRPAGQLAKCAKAIALRDAFPDELSGLYTDDELAHDAHPVTVVAAGDTTTGPKAGHLNALLAEDD